ncbi:hypothetical protein ACE1B6_01325 [Aerosakkonemataceae cyanobacterium BLCC-F154]|uniref:Uncharacterized protein n=1 Tax=Floridaenema fluviatile BLCC-F154 TaxID=3153640 RepID=A0ABV4Y562_9CYAN
MILGRVRSHQSKIFWLVDLRSATIQHIDLKSPQFAFLPAIVVRIQ